MNPNDPEALTRVLLVLLERAGGMITITDEELREADGHALLDEADAAGFRRLHLIPDYVQIGRDEPPQVVGVFDANDYKFVNGTITFGNNANSTFKSNTFAWDSVLEVVGPVTSLREKGFAFAQRLAGNQRMLEAIGGPAPAEHEENRVADSDQDRAAKEKPGPATGGGLQTTDPTFANQTKSAPKESKPDQKSDVRRR